MVGDISGEGARDRKGAGGNGLGSRGGFGYKVCKAKARPNNTAIVTPQRVQLRILTRKRRSQTVTAAACDKWLQNSLLGA